jgi:hypothetical protein
MPICVHVRKGTEVLIVVVRMYCHTPIGILSMVVRTYMSYNKWHGSLNYMHKYTIYVHVTKDIILLVLCQTHEKNKNGGKR